MSNDLMNIPAPPAYLQTLSANHGANLIGGISSGSFSQISIKGSRFRLKEPNGAEEVVNALNLDVFVIDANPHLTKNYYEETYNPQVTEPSAPVCFSDSGVAPSSRATKPQCLSCAACPHNAWGSKITPSGGKTKECADSKRVAVILAANPTGPVYELRVPAASMSPMANTFRQLIERGINPSTLLFRLTFDSSVDYPKLVFTPAAYATQDQAGIISKLIGSAEVRRVLGVDDVGAPAAPIAIAAPAPQAFLTPPVVLAFTPPATPVQAFLTPVQQFATPPIEPPKKERAKRRSKEEMAAANGVSQTFGSPPQVAATAAQVAQTFAQPFTPPPAFANHAGAVAGVVINPTASSPDMDALLAGAFKL